jgi:membrane protein implicated in regulation of membrane protease activity
MKRRLSQGLSVLYWVALPFAALTMVFAALVAFASTAAMSGYGIAVARSAPLWAMLVASIGLTCLIIWRLWIHDRARRRADRVDPQADPSP